MLASRVSRQAARGMRWQPECPINAAPLAARAASHFAVAGRQTRLPPPSDPQLQKAALRSGHAVTYTDAGPRDAPVLLAVHGAPGSVYDWRYLGADLERQLRVVRFDLPGHATTPRNAARGFRVEHMADALWEAADVALAAGQSPPLDAPAAAAPAAPTTSGGGSQAAAAPAGVYLICHSLGTDVALEMAAKRPQQVRGIGLIAPVGLRPHKALRPFWLMKAAADALDAPGLRALMPRLLWALYIYAFRFPKRTTVEEVVWCQRRVGARDFARLAANAAAVRAAGIPSFLAHAADDHIVEQAVSSELAAALGSLHVVDYATGGHVLLKHQATSLAQQLEAWVRNCEAASAGRPTGGGE
jgi:pimeloyl-ACP methyl ester carboxylesterase